MENGPFWRRLSSQKSGDSPLPKWFTEGITVEDFVRGPLREDLLGDFSSIHLPLLGCARPGFDSFMGFMEPMDDPEGMCWSSGNFPVCWNKPHVKINARLNIESTQLTFCSFVFVSSCFEVMILWNFLGNVFLWANTACCTMDVFPPHYMMAMKHEPSVFSKQPKLYMTCWWFHQICGFLEHFLDQQKQFPEHHVFPKWLGGKVFQSRQLGKPSLTSCDAKVCILLHDGELLVLNRWFRPEGAQNDFCCVTCCKQCLGEIVVWGNSGHRTWRLMIFREVRI